MSHRSSTTHPLCRHGLRQEDRHASLSELVRDALDLRGERVDRAAAHLTGSVGLDPQTALKLALEVVAAQRREVSALSEAAEEAKRAHERLFDRVGRWRKENPAADPESELQSILEDCAPALW